MLRGSTYLVLVCCPHVLDNLFTLGLGHPTALGDDLCEHGVDLAGHVRGVTADIEVSLLREQIADLLGSLLETMLNVYLLGRLP